MRLPARNAVTCDQCGRRTFFVVYNAAPSTDPSVEVVYMRCPWCGRSATQLREVVAKPPTRKGVQKRFKYVR